MGKNIRDYLVRFFHQSDKLTLLVCAGVSLLSCVLLMGVYDAGYCQERVVLMQIFASILGVVGACIVSMFDYQTLAALWKLYAPLVALVNLYTAFFGEVREGTSNRSWLNLGITSIQPSEFLKLALILSLAYHLSLVYETLNSPRTLLPVLVHGFGAVGIVLLQGDVGVAVIVAIIVVIMLLMAGLSRKYILMGVGAVAVMLPIAWNFLLSQYHKNRIMAIIYPDQFALNEALQQGEGLLSIGSGQIFGIGVFNDNHNYVPEMYNDFIFTFLGESLGFVGCIGLIAAYVFICGRILYTAIRCRDALGRFICIGVFAMLVAQMVINISMCLAVMPVIGVTLPLMSAGGSSVLVTYAALGLVLSVYISNNRNMFSS